MMLDKKKVVVGLSGGVDSSVTAYLLKKQGFEVIGMTMRQFKEETFSDDARRVAEALSIESRIIDMSDLFENKICKSFIEKYENAKTPNPCTMCNPLIKWVALTTLADEVGAYYVATGHYANIDLINGRYAIKNAKTATKDQTYALCNLSQEQLARTLMPLGEYEKSQVREIAREAGIPVADKADSQDICFIPDGDYAGFIERYTGKKPKKGLFVDKNGNKLGEHQGIINYTIGQRKGLNLSLGHPVFVTKIDSEKNQVVIGENEDLFTTECFVNSVKLMSGSEDELPKRLLGKVRYAHKGTMCTLEKVADDLYKVSFEEPVRAITYGQTAVFYDGDYVFAGAEICEGNK